MHTMMDSCRTTYTAILIVCAWRAEIDTAPVHNSRSVFRRVRVFWYSTLKPSWLSQEMMYTSGCRHPVYQLICIYSYT